MRGMFAEKYLQNKMLICKRNLHRKYSTFTLIREKKNHKWTNGQSELLSGCSVIIKAK